MSIETKIENKEFNYSYRVGSSQIVVECDISTDARGGLSKILSVTGDVIPTKTDCFVGEAKVYGKVCYNVLYLNEDEQLSSVEYCSDFVESIGSSNIDTNSIVTAKLKLQDIDSMAKGGSIRLQAVIDVELIKVEKASNDIITHVEGAFSNIVNRETSTHICHIDSKTDVQEEYSAGCNIDKILSFRGDAYIEDIKTNKDGIIVSGETSIDVLYVSDGKEVNKNLAIPFSEEIKALGVDKTSKADLEVCVDESRIVIGGVEDNNNMKISLVLRIEGDVYEYENVDMVDDIYSCDRDVIITRGEIKYNKIIEYKAINERIGGETSIEDEGAKRIITAIPLSNVMTNVTHADGEIDVDMLANVDVIIMDEEDKIKTLRVEIPASICVSSDKVESDDKVDVDIVIANVSCRLKRERDIDIIMDVVVECKISRDIVTNVITKVEEGDEKENHHKPITIYFASKGDSAWDIVKAVGASYEDIVRCNSNIDFDNIEGGERILVFRELK